MLVNARGSFKDVFQILIGLEVVLFRGFNDAVNQGRRGCSLFGVGKEPGLSANGEWTDAALSTVVGEFSAPVLQEVHQIVSFAQSI